MVVMVSSRGGRCLASVVFESQAAANPRNCQHVSRIQIKSINSLQIKQDMLLYLLFFTIFLIFFSVCHSTQGVSMSQDPNFSHYSFPNWLKVSKSSRTNHFQNWKLEIWPSNKISILHVAPKYLNGISIPSKLPINLNVHKFYSPGLPKKSQFRLKT